MCIVPGDAPFQILHVSRGTVNMASPPPPVWLEFKFLTEPDADLLCVICLGVAREPLQHEECGKLFCRECLERHGRRKPCPHCQSERRFFKDNKSKFREYKDICVRTCSFFLPLLAVS